MTAAPSPRSLVCALSSLALVATVLVGTGSTAAAGPARGGGRASFAATELVPGAGVVRVRGVAPGRRQQVSLQVRTKGAWVTLASRRSRGDRSFSIATPFGWYGAHRLRVTTAGFTKGTRVRVATPFPPSGSRSQHRLREGTRARTARFDPCRTLRYQVRAAQVPASALPIVRSMMAQVSAATGIRTRYVGTTDYVPFATRRLPRPRADLVIAWARDAEVPGFASSEGTIGLGGYLRAVRARDSAGRPAVMATQAGVVLQTEAYTELFTDAADGTAQTPPVGRLVLHEVGHALGLGHVSSPVETMYFTGWAPEADGRVRSRYHLGDLRGLELLGLGQGCLSPVRREGRYVAAPVAPPVADRQPHLHARRE